jgi:uncharacterized protein (TIGR00266 family)
VDIEVLYKPAYALAIIKLRQGESVAAESGVMVSMSDGLEIQTSTRGGVLSGLKRAVLGGESFFMNTFKATGGPGEVTVAPALPGDIVRHTLNGDTLMVQSGSYLASSEGVVVDTKWGGARGFFSSEGLFLLKTSGRGELLISSYGGIHEFTLAAGQRYIVDTSHIVAFQETMQYRVRRAGGWKTTLLGGEGLVVELTGPGKAYLQTRSPDSFINWLAPKLPARRE